MPRWLVMDRGKLKKELEPGGMFLFVANTAYAFVKTAVIFTCVLVFGTLIALEITRWV